MKDSITLIGNGNMAFSIALGLKDRYELRVLGRTLEKLDAFEQKLGQSIRKEQMDGADISGEEVILCVKPANLTDVAHHITGEAHALYSVLAGVTLEALQLIGANHYVRVMPNLAASKQLSMSALCGDEVLKERAQSLFSAIGSVQWLGSEKELDIATALSGSGPAYLSLIFEALCDGAVKQGLKRSDAMVFAQGLFRGFSALIDDQHPALLKDAVMSAGGTTAAGYAALEEQGVRYACMQAVESAFKRAQALA